MSELLNNYPDLYIDGIPPRDDEHRIITVTGSDYPQEDKLHYVHESKLKELKDSLGDAIRIAVVTLTQELYDRDDKIKKLESMNTRADGWRPTEWIKINKVVEECVLPNTMPTERALCWVIYKPYPKQVRLLEWNPLDTCWDDQDGDDYFCDFEDVLYYTECHIPKPPKKEGE